MSESIKKEKAVQNLQRCQKNYIKNPILTGSIDGLRTNSVFISKGHKHKVIPTKDRLVVLLFVEGNGCIEFDSQKYGFQKIAVFVPDLFSTFFVSALDLDVKYLEIIISLNSTDKICYQKFKNKYPYFRNYSDCKTYLEDIKSEKTISRMIIPENIVPRLSIGSVQTAGPDYIAAHEHAMLEQLFYGLPGNSCFVFTDEHKIYFRENELLHIPLGSNHGVRVDKGNNLFYLWIDFFKHQDDMSYITDAHIIADD